eukprot:TRINITY_DN16108_c0_g1_i1.p1 TRINITY_DN16108_c0_g1~~TRINITY_DN16108_c0_g1_i1.p1  ORF type:complete len:219 (-),score=97.45 TRINITY_DN16108_c0_g1_i1:181-837(-)
MSTDKQITFYSDGFWISPFVFSVYVALKEKGLPFTLKEVELHNKHQKEPSFAEPSIFGRVPALQHGDFWLTESTAIIEYLDDAFPSHPLLPADIEQKARARQVLSWLRSDLNPLRDDRSTLTMFYDDARAGAKPLTPAGQAAADRLVQIADRLIPADGGNLFGEWTIADADLAFMLNRLALNGDKLPDKVAKYAKAQWAQPSVAEWASHTRAAFVPYY